MCVGLPMQVIESSPFRAICAYDGANHEIDMVLVGEQKPGTWVLVFIDAAREVITEETAKQITDALSALKCAMNGETDVDHLFADLIETKT